MEKSYNPLENEIFLPIPLKIASRNDISDRAKLVYGYLLKTFGKYQECRVSMAKISNDINIPRTKVSKYITELKTKKLIVINKTGRSSSYGFLPIPVVTHAVTTDVTHAVTTPPSNKESLKESLKESEAAPDFLQKIELWRSIPLEYRKRLNKKQVVRGSTTKIEYCIERMLYAESHGGSPVRAFMDAFHGDHAELCRRMENSEMEDQKQRQGDIDALILEFRNMFNRHDESDAKVKGSRSFQLFKGRL